MPEDAARDVQTLRIHRQIGVPPVFSENDDIDAWLAYYARAVDFLCRQPYQPGMNVDNVLLSAALKEETGWFLALHRRRRGVCVGVVEHLALALAERSERSAKELAYVFAMDDPSSHTATSEVAVASLLLDQRFVPDVLARGAAEQLILARRMAWSKLRNAAMAGHARAIPLIIALLHDRRFLDDARLVDATPSEEAYFWILRSRRLEQSQAPLYTAIEASLDADARKKTKSREEFDWEFQQSLALKEPGG